jgi:DNA-binding MarR family transcriptional regulator
VETIALESRTQDLETQKAVASLLLEVVPLAIRELREDLKRTGESVLTIPQLRILTSLWISSRNTKQLAEVLGISVPAASRMCKVLTQRGLVQSEQAKKDRREVCLQLSKKGIALYLVVQEQMSEILFQRLGTIPLSKIKSAHTGLLALKEILNDLMTKES